MSKAYFVGIGPGAPDLLTLRALRVIKEADLIIYPGSLISKEMLNFLKEENSKASFYDAYGRDLEEILEEMERALRAKQLPVRLVSGDPSLFSSIMEHIERLRAKGYNYEIIPGISSGFMASAALGLEFTYPELSNTVIFTRLTGKTGGATEEEILNFAKSKATLVFFLSSGLIDKLSTLLLRVLPEETKVAVLYKLSRPEEKVFLTTLRDLPQKMQEEKISKTALIVVSKVLDLLDTNFFKRSELYAKK